MRESAGLATADGPVALNFLVHGSRVARLLYILMGSFLRLSLECWMSLVILVAVYLLGVLGTFLSFDLFHTLAACTPADNHCALARVVVLIMHVIMLAFLVCGMGHRMRRAEQLAIGRASRSERACRWV